MRKFLHIPGLVVLAVAGIFLLLCFSNEFAFSQVRLEPQNTSLSEQSPNDQKDTRPSTRGRVVPDDYVIGPEDVLRIDVFQVPDLSGLTLRVANDGSITVPLLGRIKASGMTATELARQLEKDWGKNYLQNPNVTVFVQEFQAKPITVMGAVEKPGPYYLKGPRTLIEVLGMAGGLAKRSTDYAGPDLYVTRQGGFGDLQTAPGMRFVAPDKIRIDIQKLLYANESDLNIPIKPLDIISISKAAFVYVTGRGVQKPGAFILEDRDKVTVFQALAMAEGTSQNAAKKNARIIRQEPNGTRIEIPVNLDKLMKGKAPDPVLAANDILFVPDSAQKTAMKRAVDVTVSTLTGLLVFQGL